MFCCGISWQCDMWILICAVENCLRRLQHLESRTFPTWRFVASCTSRVSSGIATTFLECSPENVPVDPTGFQGGREIESEDSHRKARFGLITPPLPLQSQTGLASWIAGVGLAFGCQKTKM